MARLTIKYKSIEERDKLIICLKDKFKISKISKNHENINGCHKRVYIDLEEK